MVDFNRQEKGQIITDFPDIDGLEQFIQTSYKEAMSEFDFDADISEIILYGSWTRGTAIKGKSDLDVLVLLDNIQRKNKFNVQKMQMVSRSKEVFDKNQPQWYAEWFSKYDVISMATTSIGLQEFIDSKKRESRDRFEGQTGVYNLTQRRFDR